MKAPVALGLAAAALLIAGLAAYLSFGRGSAPSDKPIPAAADAVETRDGAEISAQ